MNKIREEILNVYVNTEKLTGHPEEFKEILIPQIMDVIEDYLEKAFDAAKEQRHLGCGDYEDMYYDWKVWYDEEVNIPWGENV